MIHMERIGKQIASLRKERGFTQNDLGERLGVTYQSVSKWERGESLPDTAILMDLAEALETTVDWILSGGERAVCYQGRVTAADVAEGLTCLKRMGELLGKETWLYRCAIQGIDQGMNVTIEDAFTDDYLFECFVAEGLIQNLKAGAYVDPTDVKKSFRHAHFRDVTLDYCSRYGIH